MTGCWRWGAGDPKAPRFPADQPHACAIRCIASIAQPPSGGTGGEIRIGDEVVNDLPARRRDIAMVFQNYALYPHLTVFENMAFGLRLRKHPEAEIKASVAEAA